MKFKKKIFRWLYGASSYSQQQIKSDSDFLKEKNIQLSSEFDADSQYVIIFGKYYG
jgi:hypothetical protein